MKGRVLLIDVGGDIQYRAAMLVNGRLDDLLLFRAGDPTPRPGDVYWARVERVVPKIGGAFVGLGRGQQGYMRDAKDLKEGTAVPVQVTGYAEPDKAVPVTSRWLMKGRCLIHTPGVPGVNVSRRIRNAEAAAELQAAIAEFCVNADHGSDARTHIEDGGFIVRTAAEGVSRAAVVKEAAQLLMSRGRWEKAWQKPPPLGPFAFGSDLALRDWTDPMPDAIMFGPEAAKAHAVADLDVTGFDGEPGDIGTSFGDGDPFDHFGVWDEIEKLKSPRVNLASGAWMAVEPTRAMVTVDVNTGENFSSAAALNANLEAAKELPRQLRLRGLGGQVIIDFAPVRKADRKRIEEALKTAFRRDPIETTLAGWTPLGNFELQRKRERRPLMELVG